jgi:hypothetical protein
MITTIFLVLGLVAMLRGLHLLIHAALDKSEIKLKSIIKKGNQ